jgi:signal transduction histidine kinase
MHLQLNGQDAKVPVLLRGEIVRMLTELLRNVERHARAREVRVRVTLSSAGITLAVRDDGVGFDMRRVDPWADDGHFGLLGGRERALAMGGRFRLLSEPGRGTEVTLDLPLAQRDERANHQSR